MKKVTDAEGSETDQHYLVKELYKQEDAEFRRDEFAEKIIQYGYLVVRRKACARFAWRELIIINLKEKIFTRDFTSL